MTFNRVRAEIKSAVQADIESRLDDLALRYPPGFPAERNGLRLGIAAIEDETKEAWDEWNAHKRDGNWDPMYDEVLDIVAIGIFILESIRGG
jgi:hypothetical protein